MGNNLWASSVGMLYKIIKTKIIPRLKTSFLLTIFYYKKGSYKMEITKKMFPVAPEPGHCRNILFCKLTNVASYLTFLHWIQLSKKLLVLLLELACMAVVSVCLVPSCGSSTSPTWLKGNRTDCYTGWPSCNWNWAIEF